MRGGSSERQPTRIGAHICSALEWSVRLPGLAWTFVSLLLPQERVAGQRDKVEKKWRFKKEINGGAGSCTASHFKTLPDCNDTKVVDVSWVVWCSGALCGFRCCVLARVRFGYCSAAVWLGAIACRAWRTWFCAWCCTQRFVRRRTLLHVCGALAGFGRASTHGVAAETQP